MYSNIFTECENALYLLQNSLCYPVGPCLLSILNIAGLMQNLKVNDTNELIYKTEAVPGGVSDKEPARQCRRLKRHRFIPWVGKTPLDKGMATHSSFLA